MNQAKKTSFQNIIFQLQDFWSKQGCAILQPIDLEVGAGTLHYFTVLKALDSKPWNVAYAQPSRRPTDARYAKNPNRISYYYQFQALLKPSPSNLQDLYLESLEKIGVDVKKNDIKFIEDNWENPSVGAAGLGWEVQYNGMEISQFTYMQQVGGIDCKMIPGEVTYGLERIAMQIQGVDSIWDLNWNGEEGDKKITYADVFMRNEIEQSHFMLEESDEKYLFDSFLKEESQALNLISKELAIPAYERALKMSHILNLLDARGVLSNLERASYIGRVREIVSNCCRLYIK